jgi:hypothetical protein
MSNVERQIIKEALMTTEKRIEANQRNGLKGGVKTQEGKAVSRLNACTHGFFSKDLLLPAEDPAYLAEIRDYYLSELKPVGELETLLVERIISSAWRLKRLVRSERIQLHVGTYTPHGSQETLEMVDYRYSHVNDPLPSAKPCATKPPSNARSIRPCMSSKDCSGSAVEPQPLPLRPALKMFHRMPRMIRSLKINTFC